jgi:hypothetical protein
VPEGVQGDAAEAGARREDLEAPQNVARLQRRPDLGGEDQPVLLPGSGGRALFLQLPGPVGPERLDGRTGSGTVLRDYCCRGVAAISPSREAMSSAARRTV